MVASLAMIDTASEQIEHIERTILEQAALNDNYRSLTTIPGIAGSPTGEALRFRS